MSASTVSPAGLAKDRDDPGPQRRDQWGVTGEHAQIPLGARQVDLGNLAGEQELLGRDEIEMEAGHVLFPRMPNGEW
jgi:hypothetical protein